MTGALEHLDQPPEKIPEYCNVEGVTTTTTDGTDGNPLPATRNATPTGGPRLQHRKAITHDAPPGYHPVT